MNNNLQTVQQQLSQAGLLLDKSLVFGRLQRVAATNAQGKRKAKSGWYSLFEYVCRNGNVIISGAYGNHSLGISEKIEQEAQEWSAEERAEYRQKMLEQQQAAEQAKQEAADTLLVYLHILRDLGFTLDEIAETAKNKLWSSFTPDLDKVRTNKPGFSRTNRAE